jgi:RNA polymerase sigma factor (sigma-70 family)
VAAVVRRHERALIRVARQASLCDDDALDAYQRALEIFVRRVETVEPATEVAWLKVVVRHEAMAIRRARSESVADDEVDLDAFIPGVERSVDDQVAATERIRRSAEALRALKPDEAKALMMKAHGLSYEEIGERNGWSYTKVNRAITEGRRRFIAVFEGIETGQECERFVPIVEALALRSATPAQLLAIRPHLRHCVACRAAVRDLHLSRLRRASLLWPMVGVVWRLWPGRRVVVAMHDARHHRVEADAITSTSANTSGDGPALGSPQLIDHNASDASDYVGRLRSLRADLYSLVHRANASDVATGIHVATGSGGGRIATIAATIGLCVTSATVGTACVVSSVLSTPAKPSPSTSTALHSDDARSKSRSDGSPQTAKAQSSTPQDATGAVATVSARPRISPTATPAATSTPDGTSRRRKPGGRAAAQNEFGFEGTASAAPSAGLPSDAQSATTTPTVGSSSSAATTRHDTTTGSTDPAQQEFGP